MTPTDAAQTRKNPVEGGSTGFFKGREILGEDYSQRAMRIALRIVTLYEPRGQKDGANLVTSDTGHSNIGRIRGFRRFRTPMLVAVALLAAACTSGFSAEAAPSAEVEGGTTDAPAETQPAPAGTAAQSIGPSGPSLDITIDRVSDGDSVRASSTEGDLEIRLIGINAPEGDECFGDRAGDVLSNLLSGTQVQLHPWPPEIDDFGRELGFLVADDQFVNLALIEAGAAVARAQGDHEFANDFEEAESRAADARIGLWAPDACGEPTAAEVEIVDAEANAPGNDQENPNGEWIEIENVGDSEASLSGWSLRDESTRHRYDFPDVAIASGQRIRIFTGCGSDSLNSDPGELFWCSPEPPVWNNDGDTAFLSDPNGTFVATQAVGG